MKIAVLGCGAIGGLFLGYLSKEGQDVIGIVRDYQKKPLETEGLSIRGANGNHAIKVKVDTKLKRKVDLAIFASKINDLKELIDNNLEYLKEATVVTTQNGLRADYILNDYFDKGKIVTGIVMFGATFCAPNKIVHNFSGNLILGSIFNTKLEKLEEVGDCLGRSFNVKSLENIKGAKYLKLFINLNNCIPAILGLSMQEVFSDLALAKLAIRLNKEAYDIVAKSGIELVSLPTYPKDRIEGLASMPINEGASIFSKVMTSLSKEPLYGSILQSIKRKKPSEIDYINGEIVKLAKKHNLKASLNEKLVELVHKVEETGKFLSKNEVVSLAEVVKN